MDQVTVPLVPAHVHGPKKLRKQSHEHLQFGRGAKQHLFKHLQILDHDEEESALTETRVHRTNPCVNKSLSGPKLSVHMISVFDPNSPRERTQKQSEMSQNLWNTIFSALKSMCLFSRRIPTGMTFTVIVRLVWKESDTWRIVGTHFNEMSRWDSKYRSTWPRAPLHSERPRQPNLKKIWARQTDATNDS